MFRVKPGKLTIKILKSLQKKWLIYGPGTWNRLTRSKAVKNSRLLVIQLASLGDACTLVPACQSLAALGFQLDIVCAQGLGTLWHEFMSTNSAARSIFQLETNRWSISAIREFLNSISENNYEAVFVTSIHPFAVFISSFAITNNRFGMIENGRFYKGSRLLLSKTYNALKNEHVTKRFENLFALYIPEFKYKNPAIEKIKRNARPYVLIHPGGKWLPRRWPVENFRELIKFLAGKGIPVKIAIHQTERDLLDFFGRESGSSLISIFKTQNISDLMDVAKNCRLFIGNDSGPAHLANLYGKETIVLWGPGNHERIRPIGENNTILSREISCRPCRQYVRADQCQRGENLCMQSIKVDEVIDVTEQKIQELK